MKWLFFVFLLANLLVLALVQFGGGPLPIDPRSREFNANQVRIVTGQAASRPVPLPASRPASAPASTPATLPASAPSPVAATVAPAQPAAKALLCLRWSGINLDQAPTARKQLKTLKLTATESGGAENAKYWVYIPPLPNPEEARKKAQQIAELGIDDYFVVNDGKKWQNAVSLGVFSTREAGERRLAELKGKGVRSAVLRDKEDTLKPVTFQIRNVSAETRNKLESAAKRLRGSDLREAPCS